MLAIAVSKLQQQTWVGWGRLRLTVDFCFVGPSVSVSFPCSAVGLVYPVLVLCAEVLELLFPDWVLRFEGFALGEEIG